MYHQNAPYPAGYQTVPTPMRPPTHPPPLTIPSPQHQYPQYGMISSPANSMQMRQQPPMPPSPTESSDQAEPEYFNLQGPAPISHSWGQYVWALQVVQNPQRARMCGFGDKDRRPISPPPCVRLVIIDRATNQEVDYNEIDLTHLVLTVDIWDLSAEKEMNLVKQSTASPCISSAATGAYPTIPSREAPTHEAPQPIPAYPVPQYNQPPTPNSQTSYYSHTSQPFQPRPPPYANGQNVQNGQPQNYQNPMPAYPRPPYLNSDPRYPAPQNQTPHAHFQPQLPPHFPSLTTMSPLEHTYMHQPPANTQQYTRNLIGSLCASAFRLRDDKDNWGIWFVLQDLSVRTEGWFRLKMNFFNISQAIQKSIADAANGTIQNGGKSGAKDTAPCLAATFSNPFKVYSAKKFPGVVESTPLSKAFANQGIKIPIRKDTGGGKRGREDSDDEASGED